MLKIVENFKLSQKRGADPVAFNDIKALAAKEKKEVVMPLAAPRKSEVPSVKYDGFHVDYDRFGEITKDLLTKANVVRMKSVRSPTRANGSQTFYKPAGTTIGGPSLSFSAMGSSTGPPMSAGLNSNGQGDKSARLRKLMQHQ